MAGKILWIDNDSVYLSAHEARLRIEGFDLVRAYTLSDGWRQLQEQIDRLALVIIDGMMPVTLEEEGLFAGSLQGKQSGFVFFRQARDLVQQHRIPFMVFTIREDETFRNLFEQMGLPRGSFMTKLEGADTARFIQRVREIIERGRA